MVKRALRRTLRDGLRLLDNSIEFGFSIFHVVMKVLGPCLICLALSLIGFVTYTFFVHALPLMDDIGVPGQFVLTMVGLFLLLNTLYNYGKSILTDAGTPPDFDKHRAEIDANAEELGEGPPRQCKRCHRLKPARAHHCSVCRRCVLKMDHHCPWINNCVGFGNYRHFCLFLLYLGMSCLFAAACLLQPFTESFVYMVRSRGSAAGRECIMTSFMISCSILIALCILGFFHLYLVLTNQTTIEFQTNMIRRREARRNGEYFRNPYDLGRSRNFQQVFGPNPFCRLKWMLPCIALPPTGDGLQFPSLSRLTI